MSMKIHTGGDMFASRCQALVNPVNCKGVMGAGLALAFRSKFPDVYTAYRNYCSIGLMMPGHVLPTKTLCGRPEWILNFATKDDWRQPSNLTWINQGLDRLVHLAAELGIESVAVPALGCGLGDLKWRDVLPLLEQHLTDSHVQFVVYPPR